MININIVKEKYNLLQDIGVEDILKEHKEFFLRKSYTLYDFRDLQKGILTNKIQSYTHNSIIYYFDKYFKKYICALSNIDKQYLEKFSGENFSKFYIGVNDSGIITGIPVCKAYLPVLISILDKKLFEYYKDIIGLHNEKGIKEILIGDKTYYDFIKITDIMKKHTKINIHILKRNDKSSNDYEELKIQVDDILNREGIFQKEYEEYKNKKKQKKKYNEKYSQSFHKLIRSEVMKDFSKFILINGFDEFLELLCDKIRKKGDVEKYLYNGVYVKKSLFPNDSVKDNIYGEKMRLFLEKYKTFKMLQLKNNIEIKPFPKKSPMLKLNPILKNTNCFTRLNDEVIYLMIEVELPFIKDKKVFLGLKDKKNIRIIKRTYEPNMNTPCNEEK